MGALEKMNNTAHFATKMGDFANGFSLVRSGYCDRYGYERSSLTTVFGINAHLLRRYF